MVWLPATSPREPRGICEVVDVADAFLTPFSNGQGHILDGKLNWVTGAVHDSEGLLVPASQRLWSRDRPHAPVPVDPARVQVRDDIRRLQGSWLYGGRWTHHFGHFFVETLTNLWPDPATAPVSGLLLHRSTRGGVARPGEGAGVTDTKVEPWQRDLLRLAGFGNIKIRVVRAQPVRVERLLVPAPPVVLSSFALPPAAAVWRRVSEAVGERGTSPRVYLSRRLFHAEREGSAKHVRFSADWEDVVEAAFAAAGFTVAHPERLPITEQIRIVRGADVLAGPSGSALHLSAFAEPGTRVLELGDVRSPTAPMASQRLIDAVSGHLTAFVGYENRAALTRILASLP